MKTQTMTREDLLEDIEIARQELIEAVHSFGMNHEIVLISSEKLDRLISLFQRSF
ncbi:aspartyl-phosphate phosphatase Spo0E family protein [Metabacillus endolithicus]|uniref:Spo0E family sporulation regulatory protein-aspartic acid phosphatase n=1 Tax=Metabacillus endolithicus TaxID=1535204 RepID=A0ABW5C282_9BACI|nr:aspartyl-phosphate phosphatase Spo0E family protein [Metabacillus endolithicus]UPG65568.1 aspartyl-phosphate phosphatase Spo0E family protein [Metabacillus endolithicus]